MTPYWQGFCDGAFLLVIVWPLTRALWKAIGKAWAGAKPVSQYGGSSRMCAWPECQNTAAAMGYIRILPGSIVPLRAPQWIPVCDQHKLGCAQWLAL